MPCRRSGIRVGSDLFLIPRLTSVFWGFSHLSSPFCIEICEACLPLRGHSFWVKRVLTMTPGCASFSLWEVHLLLRMLPILSGCMEPLMLHTPVLPSLPSSAPYFLVCLFFPSVSVGRIIDRLFCGSYQLCGYFTSMLGFFLLRLLAHL